MIRPKLEYAAVVWPPNMIKDIRKNPKDNHKDDDRNKRLLMKLD